MSFRTADESLFEYQAKMGTDLGTIFHHLVQEIYHVTSIWDQYEALFESEKRVELLNASGPNLFRNIQDIFFDYVLLAISRLTDPPNMRGRQNLTIRSFISLVDGKHKSSLLELINLADQETVFCRDWRNRRIAHNDLLRRLNVGQALEPATRIGVTRALSSIHNVIRFFGLVYLDTHMAFSGFGSDASIQLLNRLYWGSHHVTKQRHKMAIGVYEEDEIRSPDWLHNKLNLRKYD